MERTKDRSITVDYGKVPQNVMEVYNLLEDEVISKQEIFNDLNVITQGVKPGNVFNGFNFRINHELALFERKTIIVDPDDPKKIRLKEPLPQRRYFYPDESFVYTVDEENYGTDLDPEEKSFVGTYQLRKTHPGKIQMLSIGQELTEQDVELISGLIPFIKADLKDYWGIRIKNCIRQLEETLRFEGKLPDKAIEVCLDEKGRRIFYAPRGVLRSGEYTTEIVPRFLRRQKPVTRLELSSEIMNDRYFARADSLGNSMLSAAYPKAPNHVWSL